MGSLVDKSFKLAPAPVDDLGEGYRESRSMKLSKPRTQHMRRRARRAVRWQAQYMVASYAELGWFDCRVIDVSRMGAGLELSGPSPACDDWDLILQLRSSDEPFGFQLQGHVRNESPCDGGTLRVGIEFFDMTPGERGILSLVLDSRWN
jgi:hypothetical protein